MKTKIKTLGISLLKKAEYDYVSDILYYAGVEPGFWLKNKSLDKQEVDVVSFSRFTTSAPPYINSDVHPILDINTSNPRVHVGDIVLDYAGCDWVVIFEDGLRPEKTLRIFSINSIAVRDFDEKSTSYDRSNIKKWLDEWMEYATMGIEDEDFEVTDLDSFIKEKEMKCEF